MRFTPADITELAPGEVMVCGTNLLGIHGIGTALRGTSRFGLQLGVGEGRSGQCYALPTKRSPREQMTLEELRQSVGRFVAYARLHPEETYLVPEVGCKYAGFTLGQVAPLFRGASENVILPERFWQVLQNRCPLHPTSQCVKVRS